MKVWIRTLPVLLAVGTLSLLVMSGFRLVPGGARTETAIFAGGCYWGVEAVFEHLRGVKSAVSGFATPATDPVAAGTSAARHRTHAEAVLIEFDPEVVTYQQLLEVFFRIAHDPTEVDRQGPDRGPQYRSIVFVKDSTHGSQVQQVIAELGLARVYRKPIVTEVLRLAKFREAPAGQQDYVKANSQSEYVVTWDLPKLAHLQRDFPELYRD